MFMSVLAQIYTFRLFSETTEAHIGLALIIISLVAAYYALCVAKIFGGGLGKVWNMLAGVAVLFAAFQIVLSLEEYNIVEWGGMDELLEIGIAVLLLAAFFTAYRTLKKISK